MAERHTERPRRLVGALCVLLAFVGVGSLITTRSAPAAGATNMVARWQMNEPVGATVMTDSATVGLTGAIGSAITTGDVSSGGAVGYRWPTPVDPAGPPVTNRLVTVPDAAELDPDDKEFSVEVTFATAAHAGNIVQKGQNATAGGSWKLEMLNQYAHCVFKDENGESFGVRSDTEIVLNQVYTVRCVRDATHVRIVVGGVEEDATAHTLGVIANDFDLTIGGKPNCAAESVECDYFGGWIGSTIVRKDTPVPPSTTTTTDPNATTTTTSTTTTTTPLAPTVEPQAAANEADGGGEREGDRRRGSLSERGPRGDHPPQA